MRKAFNNQMGIDLYEIRRKQLAKLIKEVSDGNQAEFARQAEIKAPQVNRWLSKKATEKRNIEEQSAIRLEDKFKKPRGWLSGQSRAEEPGAAIYEVKTPLTATDQLTDIERDLISGFHAAPIETQAFWINQARYYIESKRDFSERSEKQ